MGRSWKLESAISLHCNPIVVKACAPKNEVAQDPVYRKAGAAVSLAVLSRELVPE